MKTTLIALDSDNYIYIFRRMLMCPFFSFPLLSGFSFRRNAVVAASVFAKPNKKEGNSFCANS